MPKAKNAKADEALALYRKGLKLVEISKELDIPQGTIRRWKKSYNWDGKDNERSDKNKANTRKNVRKKGAPLGNKNSKGGPSGNKKAQKFGFFDKYLPEETKEIFDLTEDADPIELLWQQIRFQYAAIVRAQKIAYVKDQKDKTKEKYSDSYGEHGKTESFDVQQAWDKQANFMTAQSRAIDTLRALIKQYCELTHVDYTSIAEEQKARIELLKARAESLGRVDQNSSESRIKDLFNLIGAELDA